MPPILADRPFVRATVMNFFFLLSLNGFVLLPVLLMAGILSGAAHGFLYPSLAALVADQVPEHRRASVVGIFSSVFLLGNAGGAFIFGYVAHAVGYGLMWTGLTVVLLVGWLLSFRLHDTPV